MAETDTSIGTALSATELRSVSRAGTRLAFAALLLVCAAVLFLKLGSPALFEPDEGRNAEKAREILLLGDWATPHENFLVVLDKPIFYYWLVAASYHAFGVSEWAARFPSALAGAGCVAVIFLFARRFFGVWQALWSSLILATGLEFCLLARIVIFDMTLTFFTTLCFYSFFCALEEENQLARKSWLGIMYLSAGIATLVKGPIGVVLPGMVALGYLLACRKVSSLRELGLGFGIPLFLVVVAPWYYEVERLNPGYLRYFLWEENFIRYLTPHFNRSQPWYYFLLVVSAGFLPWTVCLPRAIREAWGERRTHPLLFSLCWALLPLIFFSASHTKLPHYILPAFPPLALLTGVSVERSLSANGARRAWPLAASCCCLCLLVGGFVVAAAFRQFFPHAVQFAFAAISAPLYASALIITFGTAGLAAFIWTGRCKTQSFLFIALSCVLIVYADLLASALVGSSAPRSTRDFVVKAAPYIRSDRQVVIYDTTLESLPFYLKSTEPIWIVWSGQKASVMGSFYLAEEGALSAPGFGRALLSFDEFDKQWADTSENRFALVIKQKNLARLERATAHPAKVLLEDNGLLLVTN